MSVMYQQLSPDGTFTKPANSKLLYGTMSFVRAAIVYDCYWILSQAVTIAIRYSAVRRQSQLKPRYGKVATTVEHLPYCHLNIKASLFLSQRNAHAFPTATF